MQKTASQLTREKQAALEIGRTLTGRAAALVLSVGFIAAIASVPLLQMAATWIAGASPAASVSEVVSEFRRVFAGETPEDVSGFARITARNRAVLRRMHEFEQDLEDGSVAGRLLRPGLQLLLAAGGGVGNARVYVGRQGTLIYRHDYAAVAGPGFLEPARLAARVRDVQAWGRPPEPDPRPAIRDFHRALEARGIRLVIVPTPVKPTVDPHLFSPRIASAAAMPRNADFAGLIEELEKEGIAVFDPATVMASLPSGEGNHGLYLATDTHWRPRTMRAVAEALADFIRERIDLPETSAPEWRRASRTVTAVGDLARMLDLPEGQSLFPPETVLIEQVLDDGGQYWRPDARADVLLLGDSFSNIYSFEPLGWGEAAGFAEQLAFELGRPLDRIARNDDGAHAARAMLAAELARGDDRLDGKRVVVWQFAERELSQGHWPIMAMETGAPRSPDFVDPLPGETLVVRGTVRQVAAAPRPGTAPYRDHIVGLHLVGIEHARSDVGGGQALVYLWSMRDNRWTRAARLRRGDIVDLRLTAWDTVADRLEAINRAEPDDLRLLLQPPCWGEFLD